MSDDSNPWYTGYKAAHHATGFMAWTSAVITIALVAAHVKHYTHPHVQRHINRVVLIVPVFSLLSWGSLASGDNTAVYIESVRDCYESWVVYNFMSLCLAYVGGPGAIVNAMQGKEIERGSYMRGTCWFDANLVVDGQFIRRCKQGTLQFVFIKPILSLLEIVLHAKGTLGDGQMNFLKAYPYILFVYNCSYSVALYALWMFYLGAREPLAKHKPLLKFIIVKSVIFLSFWQSFFTAAAVRVGSLSTPAEGRAVQDVLICCEMVVVAVLMWFAFPYTDFVDPNRSKSGFVSNVVNFVSVRDVFDDTQHQFSSTYQEYTLHGDGDTPDRSGVQMRTFAALGPERNLFRAGGGLEGASDLISLTHDPEMGNAAFDSSTSNTAETQIQAKVDSTDLI
mmetsp:Transcript_8570/g.31889  ORF Transcript_8570/g.31889 Transcript_8570/m.31889 type:complete len:394 (-) Transcript_8570:1018-2199(-)